MPANRVGKGAPHWARVVALVALLGACSDPSDGAAAATGQAGGAGKPRLPGQAGTSGGVLESSTGDSAPLLLTLTLHLENQTFDASYFARLDDFAARFERHGGRLTLEPREGTVTAAAGPPVLFDWRTLEERGHSVGSHAAIGGTEPMALDALTTRARARHEQLAGRVNRLDHVSGNCGNVDWVSGVADAGFVATTAATVLCLYSMDPEARPVEYRDLDCRGATDPACHTSYPSALEQRIHPWRARDGATWLSDAPDGRLVIFPGSGSLPCLEEEATSTGGSLSSCTLSTEDVTRALADLDAAIALSDPEQLNTFYWVWGSWSLSSAEEPVLEDLLDAIDERVAAGKVAWASLAQMLDAYTAWEQTHR